MCDRQRENGNSEMYLQLRGTFWRAFDGGAFALARVTGYQIKRLKTIDRYLLGFNMAALEKVLEKMRAAGMTHSDYEVGQTLITFSGGDPTPYGTLVSKENRERPVDHGADYQELCSLRKELLDIRLHHLRRALGLPPQPPDPLPLPPAGLNPGCIRSRLYNRRMRRDDAFF